MVSEQVEPFGQCVMCLLCFPCTLIALCCFCDCFLCFPDRSLSFGSGPVEDIMAGRSDHAIAEALRALANAIESQTEGCSECNRLRLEVKLVVKGYGAHGLAQLGNMCKVPGEDQKAENAPYQCVGPGKGKRKATHHCEKLYAAPPVQSGDRPSSQRASGSQPTSGACQKSGESSSSAGGVLQQSPKRGGASATVTPSTSVRCTKCGRAGHTTKECHDLEVTCFNCQGKGHVSRDCLHPRKKRRGSSSISRA